MQPSVGRIVHYQSYGTPKGEFTPEARAAIITEAKVNMNDPSIEEHNYEVSICVLNPTGLFFHQDVPFSTVPGVPGHWSWPPRV